MSSSLAPWMLLLASVAGCGGASGGPKNIVLVVLDSVRADHVGALGSPRATTPRLDAMAAQGLLFERAYAASSHGPQALAALWTGRLPSHGGSTGTGAAPHPELLTLPRAFLRAGFRTALASNHTALRARTFTRGFDALELDSVPGRWNAALVTRKALDLVDERGEAPLFLVVDYTDAGAPHLPTPELRAQIDVPLPEQFLDLDSLRARAGNYPADVLEMPEFQDLLARYDAEILGVDRSLGALVDGLEARGLLADTLLVVTSSHGEEFLEHGYVGTGWTLDEEVLRVPLVVVAPGRTSAARIAEPVSLVDLLPSLLGVAVREPMDPEHTGRALFERAGERIVPRTPSGTVLAELVLPELAVLRAAITREGKRVEVLQWTEPRERLTRLAEHTERLARILKGEAAGVDPLAPPIRSEWTDLTSGSVATDAAERGKALAARLARYVELCRTSGVAPVVIGGPAEDDSAVILDELSQIGYL